MKKLVRWCATALAYLFAALLFVFAAIAAVFGFLAWWIAKWTLPDEECE